MIQGTRGDIRCSYDHRVTLRGIRCSNCSYDHHVVLHGARNSCSDRGCHDTPRGTHHGARRDTPRGTHRDTPHDTPRDTPHDAVRCRHDYDLHELRHTVPVGRTA